MVFTPDNIRYCLLSFASWEASHCDLYANQPLPISGLFNWSRVFNGDRSFPRSSEEFDRYNLIHVNVTTNNLNLIPHLLGKIDRTKTKLLFNVDYAIEMWHRNFPFPPLFFHMLDQADYIFAVEESMAYLLMEALKRPVACIPHPTDVAGLEKLRTTQRLPTIGVVLHSYEENFLLPAIAVNMVIDPLRPKWRSTALGGAIGERAYGHLYDNFTDYNSDFASYAKYLSSFYAMVESYTLHSYGRTTVECAALGVPVIGAACVSSQRRCFPTLTTHNVNDVPGIKARLRQLVEDSTVWTSCVQRGTEASRYYSFDNCREMMLNFLNGGGGVP